MAKLPYTMETFGHLLEKLTQQFQEGKDREEMIVTLNAMLLQIQSEQGRPTGIRQKKKGIAVILPPTPGEQTSESQAEPEQSEEIIGVLQVDEAEIEAELLLLHQQASLKNNLALKSRPHMDPEPEPMEEIPTLASHLPYLPPEQQPLPEIAPVKAEDQHSIPMQASVNDLLKENKTELSEKLQEQPVKDLRKAIGINDRYLYINELFNGNEAMFDRSLKTLNGFLILPEAEYWMQRELKTKLGWKEEDPLARQFIQLVRRRFS